MTSVKLLISRLIWLSDCPVPSFLTCIVAEDARWVEERQPCPVKENSSFRKVGSPVRITKQLYVHSLIFFLSCGQGPIRVDSLPALVNEPRLSGLVISNVFLLSHLVGHVFFISLIYLLQNLLSVLSQVCVCIQHTSQIHCHSCFGYHDRRTVFI